MMTVSFIIPAYNAAAYLEDCLDSVFSLNLKGYGRQVIVVNDGSEDDTEALLERYRAECHQIKIINQENMGLGAARNTGFGEATGDYVYFVDADDRLLDADLSDVFYYMESGIDIIGIEMVQKRYDDSLRPYRRYVPTYDVVYRGTKEFLRGRNLMPCVCSYFFRRKFLGDCNLFFRSGLLHEDEEFTVKAFAAGESFVAVKVELYEYVTRKESITTTTDKSRQIQGLRDMVSILRELSCMHDECMQCKLDWLSVDILRVLLRQRHSEEFKREIVSSMAAIGYFPLHWMWNVKHFFFNVFTRMVL